MSRLGTKAIGVLDCGTGNLASIAWGLKRAGVRRARIVSSPREIEGCSALVVPGVGSFKAAMRRIRPLKKTILEFAEEGKPLVGVCLGMQVLFEKGDEGGGCDGLGLLEGEVKLLRGAPKLPHVGWNQVKKVGGQGKRLFEGVEDDSFFYFVHSYACLPKNASAIAGKTEYGMKFASSVEQQNVFGVQFHPEKSGAAGKKVLENFAELAGKWR